MGFKGTAGEQISNMMFIVFSYQLLHIEHLNYLEAIQ
jgi:hypothetical protein